MSPIQSTPLGTYGSVSLLLKEQRSNISRAVDHGHFRRMSSIILLCQTLDPIFLPPSFRASGEAAIYNLRTLHLLHHILRYRLFRNHRPVQRQQSDLGHHSHHELFCLRQTHFRHRRPGLDCRRHCPRVPDSPGSEVAHLVVAEDLLAFRLLSRLNVGLNCFLPNAERRSIDILNQSLRRLRHPRGLGRAIAENDRCDHGAISRRDHVVSHHLCPPWELTTKD